MKTTDATPQAPTRPSPLARRYAQALVELCAEQKNHTVVGKQLETFLGVWNESAELRETLLSGQTDLQQKQGILSKIATRLLLAPTTRNFLAVLLDARRLNHLPEIAAAFKLFSDEATGKIRATVTSASPLSRTDLTLIEKNLERMTGKQVTLEPSVDPSLIGGIITTVGDIVLDGSVRTQLASLRDTLENPF